MNDKTIHPDIEQRNAQNKFLDTLPENLRGHHAFLFRIGNVTVNYYKEREADPDEDDYTDWLLGLPADIAENMKRKGYAYCRTTLPLRRHAAERRDIGIDEYMKRNLSADDFRKWQDLKS